METNKISTEALEQVLKDTYTPVSTIEWNGLELMVRRTITLAETMEFVKFVTDICFADETNEYIPEVRDYAIKLFILEHYTNLDLPEETEKKYAIIYQTDIMPTVLNMLDGQQFNDIIRAIDTKLDYMAESNIEAITKHMNEAMTLIENFGKQFSELFGDVDQESMTKIIDSLANGLDEGKIMEAYLANQHSDEQTESDKTE